MNKRSLLVLGSWFILWVGLAAQKLPAPADLLGFVPGSDGRLATTAEMNRYYEALAKASDRVRFQTIGKTTEGRPFVVAFISSPKNLERLEELRAINLALADPRGTTETEQRALLEKGRCFVVLNESIHSTEVGPALAGMVTAHHLASTEDPEWKEVLENVVLVLDPCHNPDGYDRVVSWWREHKNDPRTRGAPMPWLYHKYVGHDNNRDWFMLTQAETRVTVKEIHRKWRPQIVIDQHQMGSNGSRLFVPPYIQPYEPNVHPILRRRIAELGRFVVKEMTAAGHEGVVCNALFDAWTPARAFMHYQGAIRFLTECASCRLADPIEARPRGAALRKSEDQPAPWKGGKWRLADIVHTTSSAALQVLRHASAHRKSWLEGFLQIHRDQCSGQDGPAAFVIPETPGRESSLAKLLDILHLGGLEIAKVTKGSEEIAAGSYLVPNGQPNFCFARALLENTPYPQKEDGSIRRPYDVTSHCLPLLLNLPVRALPRGHALPESAAWTPTSPATTPLPPEGIVLDPRDEQAQADALRALAMGHRVERLPESARWPKGALAVRPRGGRSFSARARSLGVPPTKAGDPLDARRVALYESWTANMDEGWTRFLFDDLGIPFEVLRNEDIKKGDLAKKHDVLVLANLSPRALGSGLRDRRLPERYRGGLGREGRVSLRRFVEEGGTLVTLNAASRAVPGLFEVPITMFPHPTQMFPEDKNRIDIPGSMLRVDVDRSTALCFGMPARLPIFYFRSRAFELKKGASAKGLRFPLRFAREEIVAGGYATGAERMGGKGAALSFSHGKGRVIAFSFSPQFRAQTRGTVPLFLNALLLSGGATR